MPRVNNRRSGYVFSGIRSAMFGMWQHREMRSHLTIHTATMRGYCALHCFFLVLLTLWCVSVVIKPSIGLLQSLSQFLSLLHTYVCRYHSQGQIAATGYLHPMFVEGHWVVFDEDTFGHVWIFLTSFSLYSRVTESFADSWVPMHSLHQ